MYSIFQNRGLTSLLGAIGFLAGMLLCLTMVGCGTTPEQRIAAVKTTLDTYTEASETLDESIPKLEALIVDAELKLETTEGDLADELRNFLAGARPKLAKAIEEKAKADAAIETWSARLVEIQADPNLTWADELEVLGTGIQASAPLLGPKGWIASSVGSLIVLASTLFGAGQRKKAGVSTQGLTQVVAGVKALIQTQSPKEQVQSKAILKEFQTPQTRTLVDQLRPAV